MSSGRMMKPGDPDWPTESPPSRYGARMRPQEVRIPFGDVFFPTLVAILVGLACGGACTLFLLSGGS